VELILILVTKKEPLEAQVVADEEMAVREDRELNQVNLEILDHMVLVILV
jgi:hypothetical protein